jgi:hypothetical protein
MKPVSVAYTKAEKKERNGPCVAPGKMSTDKGPEYPYGLELRLDKITLDKVGLDKLPKVGKRMYVEATCEVRSVSQSEENDRKDRNVCLQITALAVSGAPQSMEEAVEDGIEEAD